MTSHKILSEIREFDSIFSRLISSICGAVTKSASESVDRVLTLSSHFLSEEVQKALTEFHTLYAARDEMKQKQETINRSVGNFVEMLQAELEAGGEIDGLLESSIDTDEGEALRLSLAGVQKRLEGLIRLEQGIRQKLLPILSTMQFEDRLKHQLNNMQYIWTSLLRSLADADFNIEASAYAFGEIMTSKSEKKLYYHIVLNESAPPENNSETDDDLLAQISGL